MELLAAYAPWQIAAALGAALGSAFVRGLTGFGMAILLVPILALALPPVESVLLANFLSLFIGLTEVRRLVRGAERSAWRVSLLVVLFTPLGLLALAATSDELSACVIDKRRFAASLDPIEHLAQGSGLAAAGGAEKGKVAGFDPARNGDRADAQGIRATIPRGL
jgi:hypothetical protein